MLAFTGVLAFFRLADVRGFGLGFIDQRSTKTIMKEVVFSQEGKRGEVGAGLRARI